MGWNKFYVFIKGAGLDELPAVLTQLGMGNYILAQEVTLLETNQPDTLYAGVYNNSLLLVHPELPFRFMEAGETWPGDELAAVVENAAAGVYGYTVIKGGRRLRTKYGSEERVMFEMGELLLEEQQLYDEELFEEDELEEMREDGLSDREIGEMVRYETDCRVPGRLVKRYLGVTFNELDPALVKLGRYRLV
jgi:hypothetical protein